MTLRAGLMGFGTLLIAGAALLALAGWLLPAIAGAVLVLGILVERRVYKPVSDARPGPEWQRTNERFVDPSTGKPLTVFIKPDTGERRYVQTGEAGRDPT
jgi:hypothetical protein